MPAELVLDTGAFVALVDRSETKHVDCVAVLERWKNPVIATEAALTEALYLLDPTWPPQKACGILSARCFLARSIFESKSAKSDSSNGKVS